MQTHKLAFLLALTAGCIDDNDSATEDEAALTGYVAASFSCIPGHYELDTRTDGNAVFLDRTSGNGSYFVRQSTSTATTTLKDKYGSGDLIVAANGLFTGAASGALTYKPYNHGTPININLTCSR
jgi:hypothetical protein